MQHYRCFFLDEARHIIGVEAHECASDADAVEWAESISGTRPQCEAIEVWCRGRMTHERQLANGEGPKDGEEAGRPASVLARAPDKN
jgi:hypothetical protein